MKAVMQAFEKLRKESSTNQTSTAGFILGSDWIKKAKAVNCLITSRVTRTVIAKASQANVNLLVTIIPPLFTHGYEQHIDEAQRELLTIILEKKIAIYSLGEEWPLAENGGYDYLLELLGFEYKKAFEMSVDYRNGWDGTLSGRLGERKKNIALTDLLMLIQQLLENEQIKYIGYNKYQVKKVIIIDELDDEDSVHKLKANANIDAVIVGDISYEALLVAQLEKLPLIILGKRNQENIMLNHIRRRILEEVTIDIPDIITMKQDAIGTIFTD